MSGRSPFFLRGKLISFCLEISFSSYIPPFRNDDTTLGLLIRNRFVGRTATTRHFPDTQEDPEEYFLKGTHMRIGLVTTLTVLATSSGIALAQVPRLPAPMSAAQGQPAYTGGGQAAPQGTYSQSPYGTGQGGYAPATGGDVGGPFGAPFGGAYEGGSCGSGGCASGGCASGTCGTGGCGAGGCGSSACAGDCWCGGPTPTFYGRTEYLLWRVPHGPLPPLLTIVPFVVSGVPNFDSTFTPAQTDLEYCALSGARITVGSWVEPDCLAFEVNYFQFAAKGQPLVGFTTANLPIDIETVQNVAVQGVIEQNIFNTTFPIQLDASIEGHMKVKEFWGYEANARCKRCYIGPFSYDFLGGFRAINFAEEFALHEEIHLRAGNPITSGPSSPPPLTSANAGNAASLADILTFDTITTRNEFYGGQLGMSYEWCICPRLVLAGFGKIALGGMYETINTRGLTTTQAYNVTTVAPTIDPNTGQVTAQGTVTSTPGARTNRDGGLLTPGVGNLNYSCAKVVYVPEGNVNLGYQVCCSTRAFLGYNWLYMSGIARPGSQIGYNQTSANVTIAGQSQSVNIVQPGFRYQGDSIFIHGLTAGFEFRF